MALTLTEAAKLAKGDTVKQVVIELYAGSSDILANLPFDDIDGNAVKYNREGGLPGVGFRGVNEAYTESTGILNPQTEALYIAGGDLDVDAFIVKTQGEQQRAKQEAMKVRALGLAWTKKFLKGDSASDPREFDGLQTRLVGDQKIAAGTTANGTPLSLALLDEAIDQTLNPSALVMSKAMARKFTAAARDTSIGGYISWDKDEFGKRILKYNDLPILTVDRDEAEALILPFTEAATSGTATGASLYVVSFAEDGVRGIQNGGIDVRDLGELDTAPKYRTRVEWYAGLAAYHGRAATRVWSISDAAITK